MTLPQRRYSIPVAALPTRCKMDQEVPFLLMISAISYEQPFLLFAIS